MTTMLLQHSVEAFDSWRPFLDGHDGVVTAPTPTYNDDVESISC